MHRSDPDAFLPSDGSVLLQRCSGLLTERGSREVLPPEDARLPACLGLAGFTPPEQSPRNHRELLPAKLRNRSLGSFILALLRYFRHA